MLSISHGLCTLALHDADGILRYGIDWLGSPSAPGGGDPAESITPFGFRCRPRDPDLDPTGNVIAGRGAGLVLLDDGGESFAWPTQDPRYRAVLPDVPSGTAEMYATHADGTVTRLTADGDTGDVVITTRSGATVKVLADGTLEVGGGAAVALTLEPALSTFITQLLASLNSATSEGISVIYAAPLPTAPDIAATKAKSI
jgi:hypothetical protein